MGITTTDIKTYAAKLGVEPAVLHAIWSVEAFGGTGYVPDGRLLLLFEAHIFYSRLKAHGIDPEKLIDKYPNLISRFWNKKLYLGGVAENGRLAQAIGINEAAAYESASYGMFQIMGFNYASSGFTNAKDFVYWMKAAPINHLIAAVNYLNFRPGALAAMKNKDWKGIAYLYNGPEYWRQNYHTSLQAAYVKSLPLYQ